MTTVTVSGMPAPSHKVKNASVMIEGGICWVESECPFPYFTDFSDDPTGGPRIARCDGCGKRFVSDSCEGFRPLDSTIEVMGGPVERRAP